MTNSGTCFEFDLISIQSLKLEEIHILNNCEITVVIKLIYS
jgi:hypothetical protein